MNILGSILVIMGISVAGVIGYWIFNKNKEMENPTGRPIMIHYTPEHSGGHSLGVVEDMQIYEKRIGFEFLPRSINYQKELNKNKKLGLSKGLTIETYPIFFDKRQVDIYPAGTLDAHVPIIFAYPNDVTKLPEEVKLKNPEIMKRINDNNDKGFESEILKESIRNIKELAKYDFGGNLAKSIMIKQKEAMKDLKSEEKNGEKNENK